MQGVEEELGAPTVPPSEAHRRYQLTLRLNLTFTWSQKKAPIASLE